MFKPLGRIFTLIRDSLHHEKKHPQVRRKKDELEFLPAAVEILESPPSPFAHVLMLLICALLTFVLLWSWFSFIDTEVTANGRIIPVGKVKEIQSLIAGRVDTLYVTEGEHVNKNQLLIKLNPTEPEADIRQIEAMLLHNQLNVGRLQLLLESATETPLAPPPNLQQWITQAKLPLSGKPSPDQWFRQQQLLDYDYQHYQSSNQSIVQQISQRRAKMMAIQAEIDRLQMLNPLHLENEKATRQLLDKGLVSRLEWLAVREKQLDTSQQLLVQQSHQNEAKAELAALVSEKESRQKAFRHERMEKLNEFSDKITELEISIIKAREHNQNCYIRAPEDGTIQQLSVPGGGSVVQPAVTLMSLVPDNAELQAEVMVENKDIGFVKVGMVTDIKIETFPYTFFGYLQGVVEVVSKDARNQGEQGLMYPVYIRLNQQFVNVNGQNEPLHVDMMVSAEVKTGRRRLLEFFLEPFLRYRDEALNVR